jgi:hypothetical protein
MNAEKPVEIHMSVCLILQGLLKATNIARTAPSIFQSTVEMKDLIFPLNVIVILHIS